jgi:hypothetical protein
MTLNTVEESEQDAGSCGSGSTGEDSDGCSITSGTQGKPASTTDEYKEIIVSTLTYTILTNELESDSNDAVSEEKHCYHK